MCTALRFGRLFGRNLDLDRSLGEEICILPRQFPLKFRHEGLLEHHYAMIGMAVMAEGVPLYYDACNEEGLAMAGLNFPGNACYFPEAPGKDNVAAFEFIPWILGRCANLGEARALLARLNLTDTPFHPMLPPSPLHWMIADREGSLVVESTAEGLQVYENPADVLTNNPAFPYHLFQLNNYRHLSVDTPPNTFGTELEVYCQGLGGIGLPGDVSSMSRFVRMAFLSKNAEAADGLSQFFHLLDSVKMIRGCCRTGEGTWDYTVYSACMDTLAGKYYYTTDGNRQISCVDMSRADLDGAAVTAIPPVREQQIRRQN